jgi:hypothetical protein
MRDNPVTNRLGATSSFKLLRSRDDLRPPERERAGRAVRRRMVSQVVDGRRVLLTSSRPTGRPHRVPSSRWRCLSGSNRSFGKNQHARRDIVLVWPAKVCCRTQEASLLQRHGGEHQTQVVVQVETRATDRSSRDRTAAGGRRWRRGRYPIGRRRGSNRSLIMCGHRSLDPPPRRMRGRDLVSRRRREQPASAHHHHDQHNRGDAEDEHEIAGATGCRISDWHSGCPGRRFEPCRGSPPAGRCQHRHRL